MQTTTSLQNWYGRQHSLTQAALVGAAIGLIGGVIGLALAAAGPIITFGAVLGLLVGLYVLTDVMAALYGVLAVIILLPFGTLPFSLGVTPTLLDMAMGAFLLVYLFQWMTGRRRGLRLTPVHALVAIYMLWLVLSFALGLRFSLPTPAKLRQFVETLLSIGMVFVVVDLLRDARLLRRLLFVFLLVAGVQGLLAIGLYMLPDELTESVLVRLARIGYPNGGVIRYIEDNPALAERAIGTWVDPNALGGFLAVAASLIAPQLFAARPVLRLRWLIFGLLGVISAGLLLTFSRASILAFAVGLLYIGLLRYRRYIPLLVVAGALLFILPQTQIYVERFVQAFTGADLATQMRLGEYTDSLRLIGQHPVFGVGFTGTPSIDLYTDVASMYLIMANQIGLVGVGIFAATMAAVFVYGLRFWRRARLAANLDSIHLGFHAALLTGLVNGAADLYFFRIDFQSSIALFWLVAALAVAASRLVGEQADGASPQRHDGR